MSKMENLTTHLKVKLAVEFVKQLLSQVDEATGLVLVGDLSRLRTGNLTAVTREEIPVADTVYRASHGRVHIPLSGPNKYALKQKELAHVGLRTLIREVQMERYGRLLFHAPDYFRQGAWLSPWFSPEHVEAMVHDGVVQLMQVQLPARLSPSQGSHNHNQMSAGQ